MLFGLGAIVGGAAYWYSNKKKEEAGNDGGGKIGPVIPSRGPPQVGGARIQGTGIPPFVYNAETGYNPSHLSFNAKDYGMYPEVGPGGEVSIVRQDGITIGGRGMRSFNDFTRNDNSIASPFLEVNFPHNPYTSNATRMPPPLANTIDKNAYIVTYTGWRD